jgi:Bacterial regulatory proteins, luxR family
MSQGLNNREIAATLFISEGMIRAHIRNMLNRLDVGDRAQLMCYSTPQRVSKFKNLMNIFPQQFFKAIMVAAMLLDA